MQIAISCALLVWAASCSKKKDPAPVTRSLAWEAFPKGLSKYIAVGKSALVWDISPDDHVYRLNTAGTDWDEPTTTALLSQLSVASDGTAWGFNKENKIFRLVSK